MPVVAASMYNSFDGTFMNSFLNYLLLKRPMKCNLHIKYAKNLNGMVAPCIVLDFTWLKRCQNKCFHKNRIFLNFGDLVIF